MLALEAGGAAAEAAAKASSGASKRETPESIASESLAKDLERSTLLARLFGSGLIGRSAQTSSVVYVSTEQRVGTSPFTHQVRHCLRRKDLQVAPRASDEKGEALLPLTGSVEGQLLAWLPHTCTRSGMPIVPASMQLGDDGRYALIRFRYLFPSDASRDPAHDANLHKVGENVAAGVIAAARAGGGARTADALGYRGSAKETGYSSRTGALFRGSPGSSIGCDGSDGWVGLHARITRAEGSDGTASKDHPFVIVGPLWQDVPVPVGSDLPEKAVEKLKDLGIESSWRNAGSGNDLPRWLLGSSSGPSSADRANFPADRHCTVDRFGRRVGIRLVDRPFLSPVQYARSSVISGGGGWLTTLGR